MSEDNVLIDVDPQEATDVCDMIAALMRQRGKGLDDVTLYRAIVALVEGSRSRQDDP